MHGYAVYCDYIFFLVIVQLRKATCMYMTTLFLNLRVLQVDANLYMGVSGPSLLIESTNSIYDAYMIDYSVPKTGINKVVMVIVFHCGILNYMHSV